MTHSSRSSSFHKILVLVFGIAFGLVALAFAYQGVKTSNDIRSRAAQTDQIYKQWEFNGATTEGWVQTNLTGIKVANGFLTASTTNNNAILFHKSVSAAMPVGNKYLKFRLGVYSPQPVKKSFAPLPTGYPTPTSQPGIFTVTVSYFIRGTSRQNMLPAIPGTAFGNMYEYSVRFPDIGGITIDSIQMTLKPMRAGMSIQLDWVRLIGQPLPPTPTPTIVCKTGVNTFSVDTPCTGGYRYMTFVCYDGLSRREGGLTTCKSSDIWSSYAKQYCTGRSNCGPTIAPTRSPVTPTPKPPSPPPPTPKPPTPTPILSTPTPTSTPPIPTYIQYTPTP
jgi:hypothetical protein